MRKRISSRFYLEDVIAERAALLAQGWRVVKPICGHWWFGFTCVLEKP